MPVNINEVADACGVSTATVSRIFSGKDNVKSSTRDRVLKVAARMGYSPRVASRKNFVALLCESASSFSSGGYSNNLLAAMLQAVTARGLCAEIVTEERMGVVGDGFFSGAISMLYDNSKLSQLKIPAKFPLVSVNEFWKKAKNVFSDDEQGMETAVKRLVQSGHKNICLLHKGGFREKSGFMPEREYRRVAFEKAALKYSVKSNSYVWGKAEPVSLIARIVRDKFTAVIAVGEELGPPVAYAFNTLGIKVPDELSLIGYELHGVSEYLFPPQTTLQQDYFKLADAAVGMLCGEYKEKRINVPYLFNERQTIGQVG